jgi:hypothetical protein
MIIVSKNTNPIPVISINERPLAVVSKNLNALQVVSRNTRSGFGSYTVISIPMKAVFDETLRTFVFVDESGNPFISEDGQNKFKPE